jgi:hypothetical protein
VPSLIQGFTKTPHHISLRFNNGNFFSDMRPRCDIGSWRSPATTMGALVFEVRVTAPTILTARELAQPRCKRAHRQPLVTELTSLQSGFKHIRSFDVSAIHKRRPSRIQRLHRHRSRHRDAFPARRSPALKKVLHRFVVASLHEAGAVVQRPILVKL